MLDLPAGNYEQGLKALRNAAFLDGPKFIEQQSRANRKLAHVEILDFERAFVRRFRKLGVPMFAHNVVRTAAEQDALFVQGVSRAKGGESAHNWGCAVDLVHGVRAWDVPRHSWAIMGHLGKEIAQGLGIKIVWGGDWDFYDPAHWELENWRAVRDAARSGVSQGE